MACSSGDLAKERIQRKINRHRNEGEDITKLLQACKCWDGPCTTANELEIVLLSKTRDGGNKKLSELNCHTIEKLIKLKDMKHQNFSNLPKYHMKKHLKILYF